MRKILNGIINFILIFLILIFIFSMMFFTTDVASGSMEKTIQVGDILLVKRSFLCREIKRGDICVFISPERDDILLLKRVIGLPGEKVEVLGDEVYINGKPLDEPYVSSSSTEQRTFYVPENSYLFLGDNRSNSSDARYWANPYIEREDIEGVAVFKLHPDIEKIGGENY